jgi:ribose transport system permease protein
MSDARVKRGPGTGFARSLPPRRGADPGPSPESRDRVTAKVGSAFTSYPLFLVLIGVIVLFSILRPEAFPTWDNAKTIAQNQAVLIIIAFAATIPLITGEFDLSVANNTGFCSLLAAGLTAKSGMPAGLAILVVLVTGIAVGLINGIVVAVFSVPAFVATLAMATILDGVSLAYSGGSAVVGVPDSLLSLGRTQIFGTIPIAIAYLLGGAIVLWWLTARTPFGRYLYAIGGNREAVRRMGLPVTRLRVLCFVVAGAIAGLGGALYAAQIGAATPGVGASFLLPAYAAVFLGAAAFRDRQFSIPGTVVAAVLLAATVTGLLMLGMPSWTDEVFNGVILIIAVIWSNFMARRRDATT